MDFNPKTNIRENTRSTPKHTLNGVAISFDFDLKMCSEGAKEMIVLYFYSIN